MIASAQFLSRSGISYRLEIESAGITQAETLTLSGVAPVTLTIRKPDVKFSGLRTVSATIRIMADKDMSYLYSDSPRGTAVRIYQVGSSNVLLFTGYLVPFSYDAPAQMMNDLIELEAVDAVSALKYSNFDITSTPYKTGPLTHISNILYILGLHKICIHSNFGKSSQPTYTSIPINDVEINCHAWLPTDWRWGKRETPLTEVISDIAQFFGYIAMLWGDTLFLFDPEAMTMMSQPYNCVMFDPTTQEVYTQYTDATSPLYSLITVTADMFASTNNRHSIEQAYSIINMSPKDTSTYNVVSDLLHSDEAEATDISSLNGDNSKLMLRETLRNTDVETRIWNINDGSEIDLDMFVLDRSYWYAGLYNTVPWCGAVPMQWAYYNASEPWNAKNKRKGIWVHLNNHPTTENKPLVSIKSAARGLITANTRIRIYADIYYRNTPSSQEIFPPVYDGEGVDGTCRMPLFRFKVGSRFLLAKAATSQLPYAGQTKWSTTEGDMPCTFGAAGSKGEKPINANYNSLVELDSGWLEVDTPAGRVELYMSTPDTESGEIQIYDLWICNFRVELATLDMKDADRKIVLNANSSEEIDVKYGLMNQLKSKRYCPLQQASGSWAAQTAANATTLPLSGVLDMQVRHRYVTKHDAWQFDLKAPILPWSVVTYNSAKYAVDALSWNLESGVRRVLLN